jgi:hypothetical protein
VSKLPSTSFSNFPFYSFAIAFDGALNATLSLGTSMVGGTRRYLADSGESRAHQTQTQRSFSKMDEHKKAKKKLQRRGLASIDDAPLLHNCVSMDPANDVLTISSYFSFAGEACIVRF